MMRERQIQLQKMNYFTFYFIFFQSNTKRPSRWKTGWPFIDLASFLRRKLTVVKFGIKSILT